MTASLPHKSSVTEEVPQSGRGAWSDGTDDATHVSAVLGR
jgi:hypothetical protein